MAKHSFDFDTELKDLSAELRWREWMGRIEAVIFAAAGKVAREDLTRVVGRDASVELLIEDIRAELSGRPYDLVSVAGGWMFRTRPQFASTIRVSADASVQLVDLNEFEVAVLAAIAYHQPLTRDGLKDIFGKDVSRDLVSRLHQRDLITTGPRSPRAGAPYTYVTTDQFLITFDLHSLRDLPDRELLEDAGLIETDEVLSGPGGQISF
jgi:segregation and condensation protein B